MSSILCSLEFSTLIIFKAYFYYSLYFPYFSVLMVHYSLFCKPPSRPSLLANIITILCIKRWMFYQFITDLIHNKTTQSHGLMNSHVINSPTTSNCLSLDHWTFLNLMVYPCINEHYPCFLLASAGQVWSLKICSLEVVLILLNYEIKSLHWWPGHFNFCMFRLRYPLAKCVEQIWKKKKLFEN